MDIDRRHGFAVTGDRPRATDTDGNGPHAVVITSAGQLTVHHGVQAVEQGVGGQSVIDGDLLAVDQLALHRHQPGCHLGAADVDAQHDVADDRARTTLVVFGFLTLTLTLRRWRYGCLALQRAEMVESGVEGRIERRDARRLGGHAGWLGFVGHRAQPTRRAVSTRLISYSTRSSASALTIPDHRCGCSGVMQQASGCNSVHGVGWANCTTL